jgi:hypothetical protein
MTSSHPGRVEPGQPLGQLGDRQRGQVVGADVGQSAAVATERRADRVQDRGVHTGLILERHPEVAAS